jgi:hypothetical protein
MLQRGSIGLLMFMKMSMLMTIMHTMPPLRFPVLWQGSLLCAPAAGEARQALWRVGVESGTVSGPVPQFFLEPQAVGAKKTPGKISGPGEALHGVPAVPMRIRVR